MRDRPLEIVRSIKVDVPRKRERASNPYEQWKIKQGLKYWRELGRERDKRECEIYVYRWLGKVLQPESVRRKGEKRGKERKAGKGKESEWE